MFAHIGVGCVIQCVIGMTGAEQIEAVQPVLRGPRAEPGKPLIADLRTKPVLPGMARAGIINADPGRRLQPRAQNSLGLGNEVSVVLVRQANQLPLGDRDPHRSQQSQQSGHR